MLKDSTLDSESTFQELRARYSKRHNTSSNREGADSLPQIPLSARVSQLSFSSSRYPQVSWDKLHTLGKLLSTRQIVNTARAEIYKQRMEGIENEDFENLK